VLDCLQSHGSCHPPKTAVFGRHDGLLRFPVDPSILTRVTRPLRSMGITPLHHYYGAVRLCPTHRYFRPDGVTACTFSLGIAVQVLKFRTKAQIRVTPLYTGHHMDST
jgi:hypothetical protein